MANAKLNSAKSPSAQTQQTTSRVVLRNAAGGAGTLTSPSLPAGELHWNSPALGESPSLEVFMPWPDKAMANLVFCWQQPCRRLDQRPLQVLAHQHS